MAKVKVDFSDVQTFEALPDGEYPCIVDAAVLRESKSSEFPYINLTLVVAEGEEEGLKQWAILSLNPKALWRTKENLEAFGIDTEGEIDIDVSDEENNDGSNDVLEPELVGKACIAVVTTETYEGKLRNRVETILPPEDGPAKASGKKKQFA